MFGVGVCAYVQDMMCCVVSGVYTVWYMEVFGGRMMHVMGRSTWWWAMKGP